MAAEEWEVAEGRTLVGFGAKWCAPWRLLEPALERIAQESAVVLVDVDEHPGVADRWRVVSLPTFVVVEDGAEKRRYLGAVSEGELTAAMTVQSKAARGGMRRRR